MQRLPWRQGPWGDAGQNAAEVFKEPFSVETSMRGESRVRLHGAPGARDRSWELGEGAGAERRPSKKR